VEQKGERENAVFVQMFRGTRYVGVCVRERATERGDVCGCEHGAVRESDREREEMCVGVNMAL